MSSFNLEQQNANLDDKIVAGLERLSLVFKILLWDKAKECGLSPIQIQLLIFIRHHTGEKTTVSYLADEFNLTKPTISDAVKILDQKKLIKKNIASADTRSYTIALTAKGIKIVDDTESFTNPLRDIISETNNKNKVILWEQISNLIWSLNKQGIITVQRTCFNCKYFAKKIDQSAFCSLLNKPLKPAEIRIDCIEFHVAESSV